MEDKTFYEMHRSDAVQVLLAKEKYPKFYTNLELAKLLEEYFPDKKRNYIVKEDNLPLSDKSLTHLTF
jgi:hypothetical protein